MAKFLKRFLLLVFAIFLLAAGVVLSIESYFHFNPFIDTKFSSRFDEGRFEAIAVGAPMEVVVAQLGDPIWKIGCDGCWKEDYYAVNGVITIPAVRSCTTACNVPFQRWQFSDDGACTWWDFAWKEFSLDIEDGKVTRKFGIWHAD